MQGRCRACCQQQEITDWKQSLHDGASGFETNSANIKLPKIPLPKFTELAYLKSFLLRPATKSIQGYALTEDYYSLVVEFLKKRFGKKRLIIQAHMDAIIDLLKSDTMENNKVRSFLDTLKSILRSVVPLGVQPELLAPLQIPLPMRKMPKKLIEKFKFKIKDVEEFSLKTYLEL